MIYDNAVDQAKGMRQQPVLPFRLAKVSSLSNGRAYVQFYGESNASTKLYPYLEGYKPTVGDDVLMIQQGSTFIIAGKVSKDDITNNYYLTKGSADATFLTEAQADERYEPKGSGGDVHMIKNGNSYFGYANTSQTAYVIGYANSQGTHLDLGQNSANSRFGYGYFDGLGGNSSSNAIGQLNVKDTTIYGTSVTVNTSNSVNVGTSSKQLNNVYAKQFYQNGTAISTSDKRKKKSIKDLAKQYIEFFKNLRPRTFKFRDGESDRTHTGFIAQEVEEAAGAAGIDNKDLAFLCIDQDGSYGLRYEELIAVQTAVIQDLLKRVEVLEIKVNGRSES